MDQPKPNCVPQIFAVLLLTALARPQAASTPSPAAPFVLKQDAPEGYVNSLRRAGDADSLEFIRPGSSLGPLRLQVRNSSAPWREVTSRTNGVELRSTLYPREDSLRWEIRVKNSGGEALEIGDLALPLPMNTDYVWDHEETFVRRVFRHAFIAGHGSFLYWLPVKGTGWFLVMLPEHDTHLEYFTAEGMDYAFGKERFTVFVHSKAAAEQEPRGTWRQPHTNRVLQPGESTRYAFGLHWADSYDAVRKVLRENGGMDVQVAPGMVVPSDLEARFLLRTRHRIARVEPEFPNETTINAVGEGKRGGQVYRVRFNRLGENRLTVHYGEGRILPLEFFVTEPLETLIRKRAAFIVKNQQHRDPAKWYDGLFSLWDRRQPAGSNLLGPDHLADQHPYAVSGSDDPSNGKSLLVAEKNVAYLDAAEVAALEYFIQHFVWGKHQRTESEQPYSYGIYGSDSWQQNRFADRDPLDQGVSRPGGPSACRMWRTFDYTTYFALYFDLYRIAKQRPDWLKESGAADYLERAYGTARAYFEVPANLRMEGGWSFTGWVYWQYTVGNFHEKYLLPLIAALEAEGQQAKADFLRAEWEKKVKYFIYDSAWPFASEMPIDSTAYESTYADHGLVAGIEAARTVLFDDPDFGLLAYGGEMAQTSDGLAVIPRDGVRQRFSALLDTHRLHLELDRDGFASGQPIVLRRALDGFSFQLESRAPQKHETTLTIEGLPPGSYSIGDGASRRSLHTEPGRPTRVQLTVPNGDAIVVRLEPPPGPTSETGR